MFGGGDPLTKFQWPFPVDVRNWGPHVSLRCSPAGKSSGRMTRYNGYRSGTIRHDDWDYRRSAWYFVTICTEHRRPFFGRVRNGIIGLSAAGCIAAREWQRTPEVRPYVRLDAWIVMPNHVHGILGITTESPGHDTAKSLDDPDVESSRRDDSTQGNGQESKGEFRLRAHSVRAIVGQYKSV